MKQIYEMGRAHWRSLGLILADLRSFTVISAKMKKLIEVSACNTYL
jgi:hypothetical protein